MIKKLFLNDYVILLLIMLNAGIIFIGGFNIDSKNAVFLNLLDQTLTILFVMELLFKLSIFKLNYFKSNWNKFDFLLILLSIPSLIAFMFQLENADLGFLLVFRVMRIFKSFRFLKFVPGIDHLINGVQKALKASVVVLLGFTVYIFIIGVFSFYLFKDISPEYFSNPLVSLYSTFKIFTVEGWYEIPENVTSSLLPIASFFTYNYFIFIVLSGGIIGLSLVNSIFVDAMVSDNNDELEKKIVSLEAKIDMLLNRKSTESH